MQQKLYATDTANDVKERIVSWNICLIFVSDVSPTIPNTNARYDLEWGKVIIPSLPYFEILLPQFSCPNLATLKVDASRHPL